MRSDGQQERPVAVADDFGAVELGWIEQVFFRYGGTAEFQPRFFKLPETGGELAQRVIQGSVGERAADRVMELLLQELFQQHLPFFPRASG